MKKKDEKGRILTYRQLFAFTSKIVKVKHEHYKKSTLLIRFKNAIHASMFFYFSYTQTNTINRLYQLHSIQYKQIFKTD